MARRRRRKKTRRTRRRRRSKEFKAGFKTAKEEKTSGFLNAGLGRYLHSLRSKEWLKGYEEGIKRNRKKRLF